MATRMFCSSCRSMQDASKAPTKITLGCGHTIDVYKKSGDQAKKFKDSGKLPAEYFGDKMWTDHAVLDEIPDNWQGPASK